MRKVKQISSRKLTTDNRFPYSFQNNFKHILSSHLIIDNFFSKICSA